MVNDVQLRVRRREIMDADLPGVVDVLLRGFPTRGRAHWERGLRRMGQRPALDGCPRYGFLLETGSGPVGVSLMLFDGGGAAGSARLRCNLSSWAVDPAFRMQAPLLVASALKRRDVTYTNISPAPHTWSTIEAQGFEAYAREPGMDGDALIWRAEGLLVVCTRVGDAPRGLVAFSASAFSLIALATLPISSSGTEALVNSM